MKLLISTFFTLLIFGFAPSANGQTGMTDGDWRYFGGDSGSSKYSSLDQIGAENFAQLEM